MVKPAAVFGSVLLLAGQLLSGCSGLTGGRAVPADTNGPRPVSESALQRALLSTSTLNDIMGGPQLTLKETRSRLFDDSAQFSDPACMLAWTPAEQTGYAQTGWTAMVAQTFSDRSGASRYFVIQSVVDFPSRQRADEFFQHAVKQWTPCGARTFAVKRGQNTDSSWVFDTVSQADSTLWMTQRQSRSAGWSCQRALRVSNNVAIDVLACKFYAGDEAITIAHGIDARLPSA